MGRRRHHTRTDHHKLEFGPFVSDPRPTRLPDARATANPAAVRSRIRSRSNSAIAAVIANTIRPCGVVVSIDDCVTHRFSNSPSRPARPGKFSG